MRREKARPRNYDRCANLADCFSGMSYPLNSSSFCSTSDTVEQLSSLTFALTFREPNNVKIAYKHATCSLLSSRVLMFKQIIYVITISRYIFMYFYTYIFMYFYTLKTISTVRDDVITMREERRRLSYLSFFLTLL